MSTNRENIHPVQNKQLKNHDNKHLCESPCMIQLKFLLQPQYSNYSIQKSNYYNQQHGQQHSHIWTDLYNSSNDGRYGYSNVFKRSRYEYNNPKQFPYTRNNAKFFVIKSCSLENVQLSIDNKIWCSTERGNQILNKAYKENAHVFLFFSVTGSGHFCGMAKMSSPVDYNSSLDIWCIKDKWRGTFNVDWIFIKEVPNCKFKTIRLENNENHPVTFSRDTQEIPHVKGIEVSEVFLHYGNQ